MCQNGVLNQFSQSFLNQVSHSLFIEIPSRDSLLARTEIITQHSQKAAVGTVSAVSACHRETMLESVGQPGLPLQASSWRPLRQLQATVPWAVAVAAGGGRRRSARQEQSACRSSRESCSHEARMRQEQSSYSQHNMNIIGVQKRMYDDNWWLKGNVIT